MNKEISAPLGSRANPPAQILQEDVLQHAEKRQEIHISLLRVANPAAFNNRLQIASLAEPHRPTILARAMDPTPHLLIVDDDAEIGALLSKFLAGYGYRVSVVASGSAMMQLLADAHVDLVVLDIMLPGKDGLELCRELRAGGGLPIIMLTAIGGEADRFVGLELGADDYLPKPLQPARAARPQPGRAAARRGRVARRAIRERARL